MAFIPKVDFNLFKIRRNKVINLLKAKNIKLDDGLIILFSDFENDRHVFRQESSFYYLTGIDEPGAVAILYLDGRQVLYLPNHGGLREVWTDTNISVNNSNPKDFGFDEFKYLGNLVAGYSFDSLFNKEKYLNLLNDIDIFLIKSSFKKEVFTLMDLDDNLRYFRQIQIYKHFMDLFPILSDISRDLAPIVHYLRQFKSEIEMDFIYSAIQITNIAHESAAKVIAPGRIEHEVQAIIESVFTQAGAMRPAFPSIVATGKGSTILHYTKRNKELAVGELLVVDIGAEYGYYSSDLTRTYPVSGKFTKRQLNVYNLVLATQKYVESIARPGMFLNNENVPDRSLNHLAINFLEERGYAKFLPHSIGHYMGLDVHDVGDYSKPLEAGNVFTIEPGIYIPDENIGIRIEDDFLMTDDGAVCLSFSLPREAKDIEKLMRN